jgi:hypothetical protein
MKALRVSALLIGGLVVGLMALALMRTVSCNKQFGTPALRSEETDSAQAPLAPEPESPAPATIGPQFWLYGLPEYEIAEKDVVSGLGGRWISVRYRKRSHQQITPYEIELRITSALISDGWKKDALPSGRYILSKIWETSTEDIRFTRGAKPGEPDHWFFAQTVFISPDAEVVCVYCEVGW